MTKTEVGPVFISYSRKDEAVMQRIVTFLRNRDIKVWVDNEKLVPGTPIWEVEIEKSIKRASAIIVLLSPDSKESEWVRREISLADQHHARIFPVLVRGDEDSAISIRLITRQFVDIRKNEEIGLNSLCTELSRYLKELEDQERKNGEETEILAREKAARERAEQETTEKATRKETKREVDTTPFAPHVDQEKPGNRAWIIFLAIIAIAVVVYLALNYLPGKILPVAPNEPASVKPAVSSTSDLMLEVAIPNWPTYEQGSQGPEVYAIQSLLSLHGQDVTLDGVFGPGMRAAVMDFQTREGLYVDGTVGPQTWNALVQGARISQGTGNEAIIMAVQVLLQEKYGYGITVDGDFGPQTTNAVTDFQSNQNLTVDGVVGDETWQALIVY